MLKTVQVKGRLSSLYPHALVEHLLQSGDKSLPFLLKNVNELSKCHLILKHVIDLNDPNFFS